MRKFSFSNGVAKELNHYVYLLIDPRNGQTFYIGRGQGDRVFAHINQELKLADDEDELSVKLKTIREIKAANLQVIHVIQRHRMDEKTAKAVEAALIDYTPGLTNLVSGAGSDYGPANADELENRYKKETMEPDPTHKVIYIKTRRGVIEERGSLYEAVRASWVVNREKAGRADYVLAVVNGVCEGVFAGCKWREWGDGRYGFDGQLDQSDCVVARYVGKLIPKDKRKPGAAAPVQYSYN